MTKALRLLDLGWVSGLRSQTIWHAVAELMGPESPPTLLLMSPVDPYISIGYHRSIGEVDREACRRRGLPVYRRRVGGGPVYCDANQLFFQVLAPAASAPAVLDRAWRRFVGPAVEAFRALGVPAELAEGNDILAYDCKVGGTGAARIGDAVVFVGNVMFAFDAETMVDCLAIPPAAKREAEMLMRRFLAPVGDAAGRPVGREEAARALVVAYEAAFGPAEPDRLTAREEAAAARLDALFTSRAWIEAERAPGPPRLKIRSGVALLLLGDSWVSVVGGRVERAALRDGPARNGRGGGLECALAGLPVEREALAAALRSATGAPADRFAAAIVDAYRGGM